MCVPGCGALVPGFGNSGTKGSILVYSPVYPFRPLSFWGSRFHTASNHPPPKKGCPCDSRVTGLPLGIEMVGSQSVGW